MRPLLLTRVCAKVDDPRISVVAQRHLAHLIGAMSEFGLPLGFNGALSICSATVSSSQRGPLSSYPGSKSLEFSGSATACVTSTASSSQG